MIVAGRGGIRDNVIDLILVNKRPSYLFCVGS